MQTTIEENRKNVKQYFSQQVLQLALEQYRCRSFAEPSDNCSLSLQWMTAQLFSINGPFVDGVHPFFKDEAIMKPLCSMLSNEIFNTVKLVDGFLILSYPV